MPLTPQDVQNKLFSSVRFKSGYDEDEVDAFLDEVEAEIRRLLGEIDRLRAELDKSAGQATAPSASSSPSPSSVPTPSAAPPASTATPSPHPFREQQPVESFGSPPAPTPGAQVGYEPAPAALPVEPSPTEEALRRTLILAQRTADAAIAEARAEASAMIAEAREQVAATERGAAAEHAARQRERQAERDELVAAVDELRSFEREYRSRLRAYLHLQLRDLDTRAPAEPAALRGAGNREAIAGSPAGSPAEATSDDADIEEMVWPSAVDGDEPASTRSPNGDSTVSVPGGTTDWPSALDDDE